MSEIFNLSHQNRKTIESRHPGNKFICMSDHQARMFNGLTDARSFARNPDQHEMAQAAKTLADMVPAGTERVYMEVPNFLLEVLVRVFRFRGVTVMYEKPSGKGFFSLDYSLY